MTDHGSSSARSDSAAKSQLLPSEVLSRAADLIEPKGAWTRGAYARENPRSKASLMREGEIKRGKCFCVVGAVFVASGHPGPVGIFERSDSISYLRRVVGGAAVGWNDTPGRKQREVVAALRKAADLARSEGQ